MNAMHHARNSAQAERVKQKHLAEFSTIITQCDQQNGKSQCLVFVDTVTGVVSDAIIIKIPLSTSTNTNLMEPYYF